MIDELKPCGRKLQCILSVWSCRTAQSLQGPDHQFLQANNEIMGRFSVVRLQWGVCGSMHPALLLCVYSSGLRGGTDSQYSELHRFAVCLIVVGHAELVVECDGWTVALIVTQEVTLLVCSIVQSKSFNSLFVSLFIHELDHQNTKHDWTKLCQSQTLSVIDMAHIVKYPKGHLVMLLSWLSRATSSPLPLLGTPFYSLSPYTLP